ncbi:cell surface protein [Rhizobium sp. NZLR8]|uniref:cell surface protein n=1 Tax=Rhizobium sp. NZLR8 TaxID=2731104 RepID=UPI001C82CE4C|nr:cell surface protein [Rhizobium sp. NZLR8]MBX5158287.1 cell surface protein [Rhizobium sp. NZLR8]
MRRKMAKSLAHAILTVFASLASIDAVGAVSMHPTLPPLTQVSSSQLLQVAQNRVPSVNGYRGSSKARPGYIKSSNGYWYPSRAFDDYTGSIRRPTNLGNTCNYGFAPTNGSSNCNY